MTNKQQAKALEIVVDRETDKYEIQGHDPPLGPYDTKAEADDDMAGVKRFYTDEPDDPEAQALEELLS